MERFIPKDIPDDDWEKLTPQQLASVGVNIIKASFAQLTEEEQKNILKLIWNQFFWQIVFDVLTKTKFKHSHFVKE